ncbi:MAG: DUF2804 domain-containing protein [Eggerthellaceae bacterium]|jgi:hypothetical protein|nr:DUF2804 domain-containing protein [Eggerthellaceae bacterium]MCH4221008.1 DUF2804 domain-containing protein [Eggerthellaceae bacterium]
MKEAHITKPGFLHDDRGRLSQTGYATEPYLRYDRSRIPVSPLRIKEWDYYLVNDDRYVIVVAIGDLGYAGILYASLADTATGTFYANSEVTPLPLGHFRLPANSQTGNVYYKDRRVTFSFEAKDGVRSLSVAFKRFRGGDPLLFEATIEQDDSDSSVSIIPYKWDPQSFYYTRKLLAMRAEGTVRLGLLVHGFSADRSFGLFDWGRGVWEHETTCYWGYAQGWQDGAQGDQTDSRRCGFTISYGFGDDTPASSNMAFLDGVGSKLGPAKFTIPERGQDIASTMSYRHRKELMSPWTVTSEHDDVSLMFTPQCEQPIQGNYGIVCVQVYRLYGTFTGTLNIAGAPFKVHQLPGGIHIMRNRF